MVKVGGKWVLARSLTASEAALVAQGKNVQTVRDVFASVMRMEKMGEAIAKSPTAGFLAREVMRDQQLLASQGTAMLFLNKGSRLAATVVFYCGLSHLAEESGVPGLKLLVDVVGALGPEDMAYDVLSRHAAFRSRYGGEYLLP